MTQNMELQQPHQQQQQQEAPQFAQVDGQRVFLGGLDYNLLNQQKQKAKKTGLMNLQTLNSRLNVYTDRLNKKLQNSNEKQQNYQEDYQTMNLIRIVQKKFENVVPKVGSSVSYLFDTKAHFGALSPQVLTRRMVRNQHAPVYINNSQQNIDQFKRLLNIQKAQIQHNYANFTEQKQSEGQSDDIFQDDFKEKKQKSSKILIGKMLDFGIQNQQIFEKYKRPVQQQKVNKYDDPIAQYDKYAFMRKKVKPNVNIGDDGYGQCYAETGPSLQEMKQLKKAGVQIFGDAKEFKQKQRKINIGKDYNKIMRIIQERKKKA